jgi:hypothetical protein
VENISYIYIYQFNNQHPEWDTIQTQSVMSNFKINQNTKDWVRYQISTQLRNTFQSTETFFECDGDEYMFVKTFRRSKGYLIPITKTYKIVFGKSYENFEFESIK